MLVNQMKNSLLQWIDSGVDVNQSKNPESFNWFRCIPFMFLHAGCVGVIWAGASCTCYCIWKTMKLELNTTSQHLAKTTIITSL